MTALMFAGEKGQKGVIKYLLSTGANLAILDKVSYHHLVECSVIMMLIIGWDDIIGLSCVFW